MARPGSAAAAAPNSPGVPDSPDAPDAADLSPAETSHAEARFYRGEALSDGRVTLRPAGAEHAARLYELMRDEQTLLLTGSAHSRERAGDVVAGRAEPWGSPEDLAEVYEAWSVAEDRLVWVIETDGEVVGELILMDLDPPNRSCALRLWITGARDRGVGTAALTMALDFAFRAVRLHRVSLEVFAHNPRARHVYERLGFRVEGTLREALWQDGRWVDAHVMGLLRREWVGED
ncbi:GNAT family protein [Micrococcus sp.]|uniref:GNAT family N-acetyltransferase n=1 Tax=Micrococcus sp. TaxID=1271 RepID=UPI002A91174F|nr:GNAT family protein [Micrococcus sp.]MDY6055048.1 GNAT family protein [Micrococcus sp.]